MSESVKTHYRTCNLCEAMCGIEIKYQNKKIISIRGDEKDPFSRGHICPKAVALQDLYEDPNRLRHPVRRVGDKWEKISWEEAFDEVAKRLKDIQSRYGRSAVATYQGNPVVHNYGSLLFGPNFVRSLRTKNRFSATSVDQLPHHFSAYHMFGHQLMIPIPDIDRTDFFMIIGGNPAVSNGSLMSAPDVANRIKEIRKRGGKVVVVDPRRSETAAIADNHYFIKPGRDAYLLLALLNTIFSEKLENLGRVADFSENLSRVKEVVAAFTPESVEKVTGIAANDIRLLAREFALARSAICYGRMGVSVQEFGAVANWLILLMNIVTGNLDSPGGVMFTKPAFDIISTATSLGLKGNFGRWSSRVRKLPEFAGELPVSALAEEILTEGKDQVRALVTSAGNPVLSCPNGQQLDRALASLEFMVSIDIYINETTRHAHIILPPTSSLEHENYDVVFHALAIRNTAKYSPALFEPEEGALHDWQIFSELQVRMESSDFLSSIKAKLQNALLTTLSPEGILAFRLRFGDYGAGLNPFSSGLTLGKLKDMPHGIDLGPLEPMLPERLFTKSKRIELAPDILTKDISRLKDRLAILQKELQKEPRELLLIGRRDLRSNNSWMHNSLRLVKGKDRCTLLINPVDAFKLRIKDGQLVRVSSRVGSVEIRAEVSQEVMEGVVSIPHGWGHARSGVKLDIAVKNSGVSVNDLTDDQFIDKLCGNASLNGVPVKVELSA